MKITIFVVMFLFIGAFFIVSQEKLALKNKENLSTFYSSYIAWLDSIFNNAKTATGYIIKLEWLPNSTDTEDSSSSK